MVVDASNAQHLTAGSVHKCPNVVVLLFQMFIFDDGAGILYMEYDVQIYFTKRLCHFFVFFSRNCFIRINYLYNGQPLLILCGSTALPPSSYGVALSHDVAMG